jgi:hypothetical protein
MNFTRFVYPLLIAFYAPKSDNDIVKIGYYVQERSPDMRKRLINSLAIIISAAILLCLIPAQRVSAAEFNIGTISGNVYENDFFGYRLTLPDGYTFVSNESLAMLNGRSTQSQEDTASIIKSIDKGNAVTIAFAEDASGYNTINIVISNTGYADADENFIMSAADDSVKAVLEASGFTVNEFAVKEMVVAGDKHPILVVDGEFAGNGFYEKQMAAVKDGYSMNITFANFIEDNTTTGLSKISKIK